MTTGSLELSSPHPRSRTAVRVLPQVLGSGGLSGGVEKYLVQKVFALDVTALLHDIPSK